MEQSFRSNKIAIGTIVVLLVLILVAQLFTIYSTYQQNQVAGQRATTYQARVETAQNLVARQQDTIFNLIIDYRASAYDNPSIDRIAEQQLLASEYQLTALQILAIQNSQIIELLATAP